MEKIKRNREIVEDFKAHGVYARSMHAHKISMSTVRQIINRHLSQEEQMTIKTLKKKRNKLEALERKRMLTERQRENKQEYMKEYNKNYVRPERRKENK